MKRNLVGTILGKIKIFVQDFVPIRTALGPLNEYFQNKNVKYEREYTSPRQHIHQPTPNTQLHVYQVHVNALRAADPDPFATRSAPMSSIDIDAASSDSSSLHNSSDSEVEVAVTQVVQKQQQQCTVL